jgi:hypothetical protein
MLCGEFSVKQAPVFDGVGGNVSLAKKAGVLR